MNATPAQDEAGEDLEADAQPEEHRGEDRQQHQRGAEVGLTHHQHERHPDEDARPDQGRAREGPTPARGQRPRQREHEDQLEELGGLEGERPQMDPAARARDGPAQDEHGEEQGEPDHVEGGGGAHEIAVVERDHDEEGHRAHAHPDELPPGDAAGRRAGSRATRRTGRSARARRRSAASRRSGGGGGRSGGSRTEADHAHGHLLEEDGLEDLARDGRGDRARRGRPLPPSPPRPPADPWRGRTRRTRRGPGPSRSCCWRWSGRFRSCPRPRGRGCRAATPVPPSFTTPDIEWRRKAQIAGDRSTWPVILLVSA